MLTLSTSCTYENTTMFEKKSLKWITRYKVPSFFDKLAQGIFFGKIDYCHFCQSAVPHHTTKFKLKNPYRESEHVRLCSFGLNWD